MNADLLMDAIGQIDEATAADACPAILPGAANSLGDGYSAPPRILGRTVRALRSSP